MEHIRQHPEQELNRMTDMSPAEHALIGSSCNFRGEHFNSQTFLELLNKGGSDRELFEPLGLRSGEDIESIKLRRIRARVISGMVNFVEPIAQADLALDENIHPALFLGDSNFAESPAFKIGLQDNQGKILRNSQSYNFLSINLSPQYKPFFVVEMRADGVYLVKK